MATDIYGMLTGDYDPRTEQIKQQQLFQQNLSQATTPQTFIATLGSNMGNIFGQGAQRLLGMKDPREEKAIKTREALERVKARGIDQKDQPAFLSAVAEELQAAGLTAEAMKASEAAQSAKVRSYELSGFEDKQKAKQAVADVLAKNPNASSQELYAAAAKFSSNPEDIIKAVAKKEETEAARNAKIEELRIKAEDKAISEAARQEAKLEELRLRGEQQQQIAAMQGASREEVARIAAESRMQISQMMGQMRLDIARETNRTRREIADAKRNTGVLAPSLQKDESKDLENIDNFEAMSTVLDGAIKSLTPNEKGVVALNLNPLSRAKYAGYNYAGRSTPESRAYSDLQASVAQAVNIKTDAARGVQTDKDVLRFANALVEVSALKDVKATREALVKFQEAAKTAAEKAKVRVNSRRQSQNVGAYFTEVATPENTSPSGNTPKATKRWNPVTQKLESTGG